MPEWDLDRLTLQVRDARGHEHRVAGIAARAATLIGERLVEDGSAWPPRIPPLAVEPVAVDLSRADDETCAQLVADAVTAAIRMRGGG